MMDKKIEINRLLKSYGVTKKETAEFLKISVSTLNRWIASGDPEKAEKIETAIKDGIAPLKD